VSVRRPAVAGQFYERDPERLRKQIEHCFTHPLGPGRLPSSEPGADRVSLGFIVPHAGYMYSGPVAAQAYYQLSLERSPEVVVLLGPNHTGIGPSVSVYPGGLWRTPLGDVPVDEQLAAAIVNTSHFAKLDTSAHEYEHSIEVQIPFLQYTIRRGFRIVPVVILNQVPKVAEDLAKSILKAAESLRRDLLVVATTDLTHYEPHEVAYSKDRLVIDSILKLDPEAMFKTVVERDISMCGPGSTMTLLYMARALGSRGARLLKYATSGDVTGEKDWVVGYASIQVLA